MIQDRRIRRRTVLAMALAAAAGASTTACRRGRNSGGWRSFTAEEARTVDAICEQLIPTDHDPGAREAGAVNFIDIQLARHYRRYRADYRTGIATVNSASRTKAGKVFADLTSDQQIEVLTEIEEKSPEFFDLILTHTRQGFYGDPRHGGNRNMASWKMVGLPFPPLRGRQHYDETKVG